MVKMATNNGQMFYLADSTTGKPLPNTKLEFLDIAIPVPKMEKSKTS